MKKSTVIGLSGCSGSGKSTLLYRAIKNFAPGELCVVTQDNYYIPWDRQTVDANGVINFDLPEAIDHSRMIEDLERLLRGETVNLREYTFNNPVSGARTITIQPARIIFMEGIFIYHVPGIDRLLDYRLFIQAHEKLMVERRIDRDRDERGYDRHDVLYRFENHVFPAYKKYILPYRHRCDLVINNNSDADGAVMILSGFITQMLQKQAGKRNSRDNT